MAGRTERPEVEGRLFAELVWCVRNVVHLGRFPFQAALAQAARSTQHLPSHVPPCWVLVGVLVPLPVPLVPVEDPPAERCRRPVGSAAGPNSLLELVCSPLLEQRGQLIVRGVNPRLL